MKRKQYDSAFKFTVVKEVLREELSINALSSKYGVSPKNIHNWKRQFEERGVELFGAQAPEVKEYRELLAEQTKALDEAHRQLGKLSSELTWAKKKSEQSGLC